MSTSYGSADLNSFADPLSHWYLSYFLICSFCLGLELILNTCKLLPKSIYLQVSELEKQFLVLHLHGKLSLQGVCVHFEPGFSNVWLFAQCIITWVVQEYLCSRPSLCGSQDNVKYWKTPKTLSLTDWYLKILEFCALDKLSEKYHISDTDSYASKTKEFWFLIISFLLQRKTLFQLPKVLEMLVL